MAQNHLDENGKIKEKVEIYKRLLKDLLKKCKISKSRLDMFHCTLYKINSAIQLTVIYFSATSTFLQALIPDNSDTSQTISNSSNITPIAEDQIDQEEYISFLDTTTLAITSYSSLIIALARHFKIEERVGSVSNLIERFAELIGRIQYDLEILKPWEDVKYYDDDSGDSNKRPPKNDKTNTDWIAVESNIKEEYTHILDIKKQLFTSYEKIIGESIYRYYKGLFETLRITYKDDESDEEDHEHTSPYNATFCWCKRPRCFCCSFGCNSEPEYDIELGKKKKAEEEAATKKKAEEEAATKKAEEETVTKKKAEEEKKEANGSELTGKLEPAPEPEANEEIKEEIKEVDGDQ